MSGLTPDTPVPTGVVVHAKSHVLELQYANGESFRVPFELLRVYSPSAEVRGHGPGQETLQTGKRDVTITSIGRGQLRAPADLLGRPFHRTLFVGPAVRHRHPPG
jgi:hypothetical protein